MKCPRDAHALTPIPYEGAIILTCSHCGGEMLTQEAIGHIVRTREVTFDEHFRHFAQAATPLEGVLVDTHPPTACSACKGAMRTLNFGGDTGVCADRCESCGALWLDRDELEQVQVLLEHWQDEAPEQIRAIAGQIEARRREAAARAGGEFRWSRFSFANALLNRVLDAA